MPEEYSGRELGKNNLRSRDKWGKSRGKCLSVFKGESEGYVCGKNEDTKRITLH